MLVQCAMMVPKYPPLAWDLLITLVVITGVSVAMFTMLVRRWTSRRQWVSLAEWTRDAGFHIRPAKADVLPQPLRELVGSDTDIRFHLSDPQTTFVQFEISATAAQQPRQRCNVMIRHRPAIGAVAGLRPASAKTHLIDLLPLSKYPSMTFGDRFVVYADRLSAAREIAASPLPALIPPDLGLILFENHFVLDFSSRHFDPLEFGRMIALADQLSRVVV